MSDIREKIMAIHHPLAWNGWPHNGPFLVEAFALGLSAAADIAEAEVQRLEARVREMEDFARFMCATWVEIDSFVRDNCTGDEMMKYPVIQGTSNQLALTRIAKQEYDKANIAKAVERVIGGE